MKEELRALIKTLKEHSGQWSRKAKRKNLSEESKPDSDQGDWERTLTSFVDHYIVSEGGDALRLAQVIQRNRDPRAVHQVLVLLLEKANGVGSSQDLLHLANKMFTIGPKILLGLQDIWHSPVNFQREMCLFLAISKMLEQLSWDEVLLVVRQLNNVEKWVNTNTMLMNALQLLYKQALDQFSLPGFAEGNPRVPLTANQHKGARS
jgi:hypothetical protein